ncbi:MAG: ABC transporter ATP-binding protein [Thermodesulfovibrionales bacterium]
MPALISVAGVSKLYNAGMPDEVTALSDISVEIGRGEAVALKGPSGSGKTTLLSILGCMSRPTSGSVLVDGRDVAKLPETLLTGIRRSRFGFVFQQFNLLRDMSVFDNVTLPLYPTDLSLSEMSGRARLILDRFGIGRKEAVKVKSLSGGEQQRVAIARALINLPEIVIADEPTAHLDRALARDLAAIMEGLHRDGTTLVIATHDPFLIEQPFVGTVVEMHDGRVTGILRR